VGLARQLPRAEGRRRAATVRVSGLGRWRWAGVVRGRKGEKEEEVSWAWAAMAGGLVAHERY
jgi:hypothetical protein